MRLFLSLSPPLSPISNFIFICIYQTYHLCLNAHISILCLYICFRYIQLSMVFANQLSFQRAPFTKNIVLLYSLAVVSNISKYIQYNQLIIYTVVVKSHVQKEYHGLMSKAGKLEGSCAGIRCFVLSTTTSDWTVQNTRVCTHGSPVRALSKRSVVLIPHTVVTGPTDGMQSSRVSMINITQCS